MTTIRCKLKFFGQIMQAVVKLNGQLSSLSAPGLYKWFNSTLVEGFFCFQDTFDQKTFSFSRPNCDSVYHMEQKKP